MIRLSSFLCHSNLSAFCVILRHCSIQWHYTSFFRLSICWLWYSVVGLGWLDWSYSRVEYEFYLASNSFPWFETRTPSLIPELTEDHTTHFSTSQHRGIKIWIEEPLTPHARSSNTSTGVRFWVWCFQCVIPILHDTHGFMVTCFWMALCVVEDGYWRGCQVRIKETGRRIWIWSAESWREYIWMGQCYSNCRKLHWNCRKPWETFGCL